MTQSSLEEFVDAMCQAMVDALYCGCRCTAEPRVVDGTVVWDYRWDAACPGHSGAERVARECGHHAI